AGVRQGGGRLREFVDRAAERCAVSGQVVGRRAHEPVECAVGVRALRPERLREIRDGLVQFVDLHRGRGPFDRDVRAGFHRRPPGVGREELDGAVGDHRRGDLDGLGVGGDVDAAVDVELDLHRVPHRGDLVDGSDRDTEDPHVRTRGHTDGGGEGRGDRGPAEAGDAHVDHRDHRDDDDEDQRDEPVRQLLVHQLIPLCRAGVRAPGWKGGSGAPGGRRLVTTESNHRPVPSMLEYRRENGARLWIDFLRLSSWSVRMPSVSSRLSRVGPNSASLSATSLRSSVESPRVDASTSSSDSERLLSSPSSWPVPMISLRKSSLRSARISELVRVASSSSRSSSSRLEMVCDNRVTPSIAPRNSSGVACMASVSVSRLCARVSSLISSSVSAAEVNAVTTSDGPTVRSSGIGSDPSSSSVPAGSRARYFCPSTVLIWMLARVSSPSQASLARKSTPTLSPSRSTPVTTPTLTPATRTSLPSVSPAASEKYALYLGPAPTIGRESSMNEV